MGSYKLYTKEPIETIEDIILHEAIPLGLKELSEKLEKNNLVITRQKIINKIPLLITRGMTLLRQRGEDGKKIYELFHGCILAAFLDRIEPNFQHIVCYPEDSSYDFLIIPHLINKKPDFILSKKEIYKEKGPILKVELAEIVKIEDLEKIIIDKSKDRKRILLLSIAFNGKINFKEVFNKTLFANKKNFETIWLLGQTINPNDKNKLCYFLCELVKYKKIFPLFELLIKWSKIKNELNGILIKIKNNAS